MKINLKISSDICSIGVIAVAVMGLMGYLPGLGLLGSIKEDYIPMAPSTAVSFIAIGCILLFLNAKPLSGKKSAVSLIVILIVSLFGILDVIGYYTGTDLNFEDTFVPVTSELNGVAVGRMSPATGALFFLSGIVIIALFPEQRPADHKKLIEYIGGGLNSLILMTGFVFCLAYIYGSPLLYGYKSIIPMALTTALGFMLLSISILLSQKDAFPLKLLTDTSTQSYLFRFMLPLAILSVISGGIAVLSSMQWFNINPAIASAALTLLISFFTGLAAIFISRHMGMVIDRQNDLIRQSRKALSKSEEQYRILFETMVQGVVYQNADGEIISANPAAGHILGLSLDQMKARTSKDPEWKVVDKDKNELPEDRYPAMLALGTGKVVKNFILGVYNPGINDYVWIIVNSVPQFKDGSDSPYQVYSTFLNITEQKQAEEALRESETRYSTFINSTTDMVFLKDGQFRYIVANKALADNFGRPIGGVIGLCDSDLMLPKMAAACRASDQKAIETVSVVVSEELWGDRTFETTKFPVLLKHNQTGVGGFIRDITDRKRAQADRDRLMTAIEQSNEIVIITNPEGIIQYVNQAFETITGYTRKEALGRNPRILKSGKQDETFYHRLWSTISRGDTFNSRIINKRKDGTFYTEDANISPVRDAEGKIVNYVGVNRDVTAHIQLEIQLHQAQKMESVGNLAGGVAHDFNNMLTIIISYAQMLMNEADPSGPIHQDLGEILNAAQRSSEITRQLLAFARRQTISPQVLDFNQTVENMLKMLRRLIGEDIDLAWLPSSDLWPVMADPSQIDQILANLCVNSRDAIGGVGKVTIETENIIFDNDYCSVHSGFVPGEFVLLAVSDDGCGMDKKTIDCIFEPFFTTKSTGYGTGLGLATVYGIVKQNNGFINVYSEPGKGTTFKVYLPRHAGEARETKSETAVKIPLARGETVLIVEDEASILKLGKRILENLGYTVLEAETPDLALDLAQKHAGRIHILLTDVVMPEMNGRDLANRLQTFYPDLKVLFMSGYPANVISHRGVLEAGVHFMQKPFSSKDLAIKIREALDETE
ncbi:MAG: hypothetical protein A2277_12740 [Desulfobacterales bacterium RIFOXYA12_FULL_46_15]|nr:MAG: hypothetical protein A2277_12740 [Desulfobacterales bacterium RIFOXYA12_FULL_46_15]